MHHCLRASKSPINQEALVWRYAGIEASSDSPAGTTVSIWRFRPVRGKAGRPTTCGRRKGEAFQNTLYILCIRGWGYPACAPSRECAALSRGHLAASRGSIPQKLRAIVTDSRGELNRRKSKGCARRQANTPPDYTVADCAPARDNVAPPRRMGPLPLEATHLR